MPIATRLTNTGTLLVNGIFDENTSITPAKFRTSSTTVYAGTLDEVSLPAGAVSFNGSSTYLSVPYSSNFDFGSGDFTIEFWMYTSSSGNATKGIMAFSHNASNYAQALWYFPTASTITFWCSSNGTSWDVASNVAAGTFALNNWYHVAVSRSGSSIRLFFAGVLQSTVTFGGTLAGTYDRNWIGATVGNGYYNGLLSNIRVVKGTALYTANFTPPQAILPAVTNTQLLLNVTSSADFIKDNSTSNLTVTNVGPATWNATGPFNQGSTVLKQRQVNDGTLEVSTQFDEFTGIASVVEGLVAYYDPAYSSSYSGSGANLYNLVDGVAATLNGTYSAGTAAVGTSVSGMQTIRLTNSDLVTATNNISHIQAPSFTNVTTVSIWFYQHTYNGIARYILDGRTGGGEGWIYNGSIGSNWSTGVTYVNGGASSGTPAWSNWGGDATGVWKNVTFIANTPFTDDINIFSRFSDNEGLDVTFGPVLIYNRVLTQAENLQNFNALRNRYGI